MYLTGWARVDVTPPVGIHLAGYAARVAPSDGVYHRLHATCLAIADDGGAPVVWVTIDWLGFYDRTDDARARIAARTGVPPERILLTGTHTHTGPVLRRDMDARRHGGLDEGYIDASLDALAGAARRALEASRPARLRAGTGWCGIASSRRRPDGSGGVLFKPSLDAPHDHRVRVLAVESPDGALRHLLFAYACHPTGTGAILQIGADYPGFACDALEARYPGVTAAFFQGCAGDQKVDARDAAGDGYRKLEIDEVRQRGEALAAAVARVVDADDLTPVDGPLTVAGETVTLTTEAVTDDLRAHLDAEADYVRAWARHHLELSAAGTPARRAFPFEVQTLRLGDDLAVVGMAGEMSVEYGLRQDREFGAACGHVWSLGYANAMVGYVPVRRQIAEGGYEVVENNRRLLYTGPFTTDTEETVHAAVRRCLGR